MTSKQDSAPACSAYLQTVPWVFPKEPPIRPAARTSSANVASPEVVARRLVQVLRVRTSI